MKTTFKKSALAFLTCILALAFALTGCSGGGKDPKANFVGSWQYSGGTLDGEELTDEYMDMLKEWGLNCILILDEDGTGVLDMFLEVADLKWEAKDATTVTITAEDESHDLKLKDDKLVLEVEGDKLIFTKGGADRKLDREAVRTGGSHVQQGEGRALPPGDGGRHGADRRREVRGGHGGRGQEVGDGPPPAQLHRGAL